MKISTHSLTKRLTQIHDVLHLFMDYFNSQPHEEADGHFGVISAFLVISTHSLTKRLTAIDEAEDVIAALFQLTASRRG